MSLTTPNKIRSLQRKLYCKAKAAPERPVVCLAVKPVGKPDAGNRHVRFDERGWETGRWPKAKLPRPSSTLPLDPAPMIGAQASSEQLEKILSYIDIGRQEGAKVLTGGSRNEL